MNQSDAAIELRALEKSYDAAIALRGIDLQVQRGQVFGFLGPNGAGKTTAIRCMLDLIRPTAGAIRVLSIDPQQSPVEVRRRVGYLPGELSFDENLTTRRLLRMLDSLRGGRADFRQAEQVIERLQLDPTRTIKNLSKGNKQKVGLVQAFMHQPELLLLDEPTAGLDPLMQQQVLQLAAEARAAGATVFFSSHVLSEVQAVADHVAVVRDGRIVESAPTRELLARALRRVTVVFNEAVDPDSLNAAAGVRVLQVEEENRRHLLEVEGDMDGLVKQIAVYHVSEVRADPTTLEDVFLRYYTAGTRDRG